MVGRACMGILAVFRRKIAALVRGMMGRIGKPEAPKPDTGWLEQRIDPQLAQSELASYHAIAQLIPELCSYKRETIFFLRDLARERGFDSLASYHIRLLDEADEVAFLRKHLTFSGTHFFRGEDWDFFGDQCLSALSGRKDVRIWCAGCSSGEEAYSTAMLALEHLCAGGFSILATDYSDEMLARCRRAEYASMHLEEIPERFQHHVIKLQKGSRFTFDKVVLETVHAENLNLITDEYPVRFDVIVCRNVIKFFASDVRDRVKRQLIASLAEGGFLFVSNDETAGLQELLGDPEAMGVCQIGGRSIYRKCLQPL